MKSDIYPVYLSQTGLKSFKWMKIWNNVFSSCNPVSFSLWTVNFMLVCCVHLHGNTVVWQEGAASWSETPAG